LLEPSLVVFERSRRTPRAEIADELALSRECRERVRQLQRRAEAAISKALRDPAA
jgi:hypothetical protein